MNNPAQRLVQYCSDSDWVGPFAAETLQRAPLLEKGCVLAFPHLRFNLHEREKRFLSSGLGDGRAKNVSLDPRSGALRGVNPKSLTEPDLSDLKAMIGRFSAQARGLVAGVIPGYGEALEWGLTSFRPAQVAGRKTSWRKDDTRLHVDAFPSRPNQGRRILRVFTNLGSLMRVWRLGEAFEKLAEHFAPSIKLPLPGSAWLLQHLRIVKGRRTPYDHVMLQLHNRMKADTNYQQRAIQEEVNFPPGATWMVFTDQVSHAAISGQFALEQTLFLPVGAMVRPECAPIRVLEKQLRHRLS